MLNILYSIITSKNITCSKFFLHHSKNIDFEHIAKTCGFIKRQRNLSPRAFTQTLIEAAGGGLQFNFAKMCRRYCFLSDKSMKEKSFHSRLISNTTTDFINRIYSIYFKSLFHNFCSHKGKILLTNFQNRGLDIDEILCIDGTYWNVSNDLAHIFPGARKRHKETESKILQYGDKVFKNAQIGLQTTYSVVSGFIKSAVVSSATASERDYVEFKGQKSLIIMDAGYLNYTLLKQISDNGCYFMIRGKGNMTGSIIDCMLDGEKYHDFIGKNLNEPIVRNYALNKTLDMKVKLSNGFIVRVLRVYSKAKGQISFLISNIMHNTFTAKDLSLIQKIRWRIEIFFKCLKSGVNLRGIKTKYVSLVYTLLFASMIAALLKQFIYSVISEANNRLYTKDTSILKIYNSSLNYYFDLLRCILQNKYDDFLELMLKIIQNSKIYNKSPQAKSKITAHKTFDSIVYHFIKNDCKSKS